MKKTSLIAVYLVAIFYHILWLMLATFGVSNAFNPTFIQLLLIFNSLCSVSGEYIALLYDVPKFTCNIFSLVII